MWNATVFGWVAGVAVLTLGIMLLVQWIRRNNLSVKWYDWTILSVGLIILSFTIQNFITSFTEDVPEAAWMFLLIFGIPSLVLVGIFALQVWRRSRAS